MYCSIVREMPCSIHQSHKLHQDRFGVDTFLPGSDLPGTSLAGILMKIAGARLTIFLVELPDVDHGVLFEFGDLNAAEL